MTSRWTQKKMAQVAQEERVALGLGLMDPLNPYQLAEAWGIPVYPISVLAKNGCPQDTLNHFKQANSRAWSAALIPSGSRRIVIENDSHEGVRRRSSVAHELSHHLLEHEFPVGMLGANHMDLYSPTIEKQALFLSGELLVPGDACRKLAFRGADNAVVAARFNVSLQFAQMRMTGPRRLAERALAKQARAR